ncbi:hypothetical protein OHA72_60390 [Dactylosporangium sp. NBC_01737]|uniref:hypothetical protein n=1 Tax=Dactylosporangium sp. NBC_01737 TaxID=2975959 RepID=UPI002E10EF97|nr:hypothetical protein OHA72_60390 [Dactylosporangium sp. NBC_01737]
MSDEQHMNAEPRESDGTPMNSETRTSDGTLMNSETRTSDALARRYQALLRAYPKAWREARGDEMLGTLLDAAEPGLQRPSARESVSIVAHGTLERLGLRRRRTAGAVWAEGLRIGALLLLAQALAERVTLAIDALNYHEPPGLLALHAAAITAGIAAAVALIRGRLLVSAVLTALWCVAPAMHGAVSWDLVVALVVLTGLGVTRPADRRRTSAAWLLVLPLILAWWFGYHLATGVFISPAGSLLYVAALLVAVTAGVAFDPRLPIAVACLSLVLMLQNSVHVSTLMTVDPGRVMARLSPAAVVLGAIAVALLTIGHLRARRLARI